MNCGNCHQPLEAGAQFCGNCGTPVLQPGAAAPVAAAPPTAGPVEGVPPSPVLGGVPMPPQQPAGPPMSPIQNQFPGAAAKEVPNHMVFSIIVLITCSLLFGGIALVYSMKVNKLTEQGDIAGAQKASKTAKTLDIVGLCIGLPLTILYVMGTLS